MHTWPFQSTGALLCKKPVGVSSLKCNRVAKRSQSYVHTLASTSQHTRLSELVGSKWLREVDHEHKIIAQNHRTNPGSVAHNKHRVIGRHDSGGSASLSPARDH